MPRGERTDLFVRKVMITFLEKYAIYYANTNSNILLSIRYIYI